jgi:hypothetical protein
MQIERRKFLTSMGAVAATVATAVPGRPFLRRRRALIGDCRAHGQSRVSPEAAHHIGNGESDCTRFSDVIVLGVDLNSDQRGDEQRRWRPKA